MRRGCGGRLYTLCVLVDCHTCALLLCVVEVSCRCLQCLLQVQCKLYVKGLKNNSSSTCVAYCCHYHVHDKSKSRDQHQKYIRAQRVCAFVMLLPSLHGLHGRRWLCGVRCGLPHTLNAYVGRYFALLDGLVCSPPCFVFGTGCCRLCRLSITLEWMAAWCTFQPQRTNSGAQMHALSQYFFCCCFSETHRALVAGC